MSSSFFQKAKKYLPFIGIFILIYVIYSLDVDKITEAFLSVLPEYVILAILLTIPVLFLRNYAWQLIQREQHISLGFFSSLKILLISYFYGTISPGYLGQLVKVPYMKEKTGEPYGKLFINVFIDTFLRSFSLYVMMILGAVLVVSLFPELFYFTIFWVGLLVLIVLYFLKQQRGEKLFRLLVSYVVPKRWKSQFYQFVETFYTDFPRIRALILPLVLGVIVWILIFTQEYLIVLALNLNIPYVYFLLLFPIANSAGYLPITFAGLGARELTAIVLFSTLFGVAEEKVFVLSLLGFIITYILVSFVGFLLSLADARQKEIPA